MPDSDIEELQGLPPRQQQKQPPREQGAANEQSLPVASKGPDHKDHLQRSAHHRADGEDEPGAVLCRTDSPQPGHQQQNWNKPQINVYRTIAACYGLFVIGLNDAQYGAIIPYLEAYYSISYTVVSLIFICPAVGYLASAAIINLIHTRLGQRGIALIGPSTRLLGYILISQHPPYPVVVVGFVLASLGNGLEDAAWNAWIGHLQRANEVLGFLHGAYGLGGVLSPLITTALITKAGLGWWTFSYVMIGALAVELVAAGLAFWRADGRAFREQHAATSDEGEEEGRRTGAMQSVLGNRIVWTCALFLLVYVGIEVSLGGWTVTFMIRIRDTAPFDAGISATAFWLGITVGRVALGFITGRIGEKVAILIYLFLALSFHLIFYLVPSATASFLAVSLEGFFLGPLFPAAVVAATKLLPPRLHVAGVGFAAALGATGACVLPFAVGAIAQVKGVQVLMPIVLAFLVADVAVWSALPGRGLKARKGD